MTLDRKGRFFEPALLFSFAEAEESDSHMSENEDSSQKSSFPVTCTVVNGSDWFKSLQQKTPSTSECQIDNPEIEDSAKKQKKYSRNGLAEQFRQLQSRDKSAVEIWHQQGKPSAKQDSKSIQLQVIGFENLYSMQLVKCVLCKNKEASQTNLKKSDVEDSRKGDILPSKKSRDDGTCNKRLVMFPVSQSEQLNLQIGSHFKIFPPWQKLQLNDGQQILLCTKYCHIVQQPDNTPVTLPSSDVDKLTNVVTASWNCPCVHGLQCSQTLCPAYQFPSTLGQFQETGTAKKRSSARGKGSNSNLLKSSTSHLFTVSSKPCEPSISKTGSSSKDPDICDSLLKSIESCRTAVDGGGDGYSGTVSFSGHVHRAVTVRNGSSKTRYHLLVEDKFGSICEVQLSTKSLTRAGLTTHSCEYNTFKFSGLAVRERLIRDRNEGLFTMVDSVWSGEQVIDSQDNSDLQNLSEPPGFCYILQETNMSPFTIKKCSSNILPCKSPVYIQLSEMLKSEAMRRASCVVKVFYIHLKEKVTILHVTDYSLDSQQSYSMIHVSNACDFFTKASTLSERVILVLQDLFVRNGELHADEYTSISLSNDMLNVDASLSREISRLQQVSIDVTDIHKGVTEDALWIIKDEPVDCFNTQDTANHTVESGGNLGDEIQEEEDIADILTDSDFKISDLESDDISSCMSDEEEVLVSPRKRKSQGTVSDGKTNPLSDHLSDNDENNTTSTGGWNTLEKNNQAQTQKKIKVQEAGKAKTKRLQRRQACIYCGNLVLKLSRHLSMQHADKTEVARILNLKKNSKERRNAWIRLASKGNFVHNQKVKEKGSGILLTRYRKVIDTSDLPCDKKVIKKSNSSLLPCDKKVTEKSDSSLLPCEYCLTYITDKDMWNHHRSCISKPKNVRSDGRIRDGRLLLPKQCSEQLFKDVVSKLRDDDVTSKIKSDALILEFGQRIYSKYEYTQQYISQRLRELATCVIGIHKQDITVTALGDVITPAKWDTLTETIKKEAGFDVKTQEYENPLFAIKCGQSLKKCAKILKNTRNAYEGKISRERAARFLEMYEDEWDEVVGVGARKSLDAKKCDKVKLLPLVEDVMKLSKHIETEIEKVKSTDNENAKEEAYVRMCKLTLAQVILLNRQRAWEAQHITKEDFSKASFNVHVDEDDKNCLSKFEQELCESHLRVETRGKHGKKVTILFTCAMQENVKYILSLHDCLGCSSRYIFVPLQGLTPYRGTRVLREIARETELMYVSRITSNTLKKQLATLFQVLCLIENDQDILSKFLGHDIRINTHCLPEGMVEVAKVARLLHLMNNGKISSVAGKALDDIDVDLPLEDETESEEDDTNNVAPTPTPANKQGTLPTPANKQGTLPTPAANRQVDEVESEEDNVNGVVSTPTPAKKQGTLTTPANKQGTLPTPANKQGTLPTPANKQGTLPTPVNKQGTLPTPAKKQGTLPTPAKKQDMKGSCPYTLRSGQKRKVEQDKVENDNDRDETLQPPATKKKLCHRGNLIEWDEVEYVDDSGDETWQPPDTKKKSSLISESSSATDSEDAEDQHEDQHEDQYATTSREKNKNRSPDCSAASSMPVLHIDSDQQSSGSISEDSMELEDDSSDTENNCNSVLVPEIHRTEDNDDSDSSEFSDIAEQFSAHMTKKGSNTLKKGKKGNKKCLADTTKTSERPSSGVKVQFTNSKDGKKKYDKLQFCLYCGKGSTSVRRHYLLLHKTEPEVKQILDQPLNSSERKLKLLKLRHAGNFKHNTEVLEKNEGLLVTSTKSSNATSPEDYLPCKSCLGFYYKANLWRHRKACPFAKDIKKWSKVQAEAYLLLPFPVQVSKGLKENIFGKMVVDEVTVAARQDRLIVRLGENLYQKYRNYPHLYQLVSQKMRELARLLIRARKHDSDISSFYDLINTDKFPVVVAATKSLCSFDEKSNKYGNPSLALKLGHTVKKCARICKRESLISGNTDSIKRAKDFLFMCEGEWTGEISSMALQTLSSKKVNKRQNLMVTLSQDMVKLQLFFQKKTEALRKSLEESTSFSKSDWELLNQISLAQLVLFNRSHAGETQRLTAEVYMTGKKSETPPEEVGSLMSSTEKALLATVPRVDIPGVKGQTVLIFIPHSIGKNIDLLLKWRSQAGVHKDNKYLFARPNFSCTTPLNTSFVLKKFATEANVSSPLNITSIKLRKQMTIVSQILNLEENDLKTLETVMGHDIKVHGSFSRLPQEPDLVARMGLLLIAFNNGTINQFTGKSVDDISLDEIGNLSSDSEVDEDKDENEVDEDKDENDVNGEKDENDVNEDKDENDVNEDKDENDVNEDKDENDVNEDKDENDVGNNDDSGGDCHLHVAESSKAEISSTPARSKRVLSWFRASSSSMRCEDNDDEEFQTQGQKQRKTEVSVKWSAKDTSLLRKEFKDCIFSRSDQEDCKGSLPSKQQIISVIRKGVIESVRGLPEEVQYLKIRTKLFNERKTVRMHTTKHLKKMCLKK